MVHGNKLTTSVRGPIIGDVLMKPRASVVTHPVGVIVPAGLGGWRGRCAQKEASGIQAAGGDRGDVRQDLTAAQLRIVFEVPGYVLHALLFRHLHTMGMKSNINSAILLSRI